MKRRRSKAPWRNRVEIGERRRSEKNPTRAQPARLWQGKLGPGDSRALGGANKTIDFRTSILYVVDEEDWPKTCCVVERRMEHPLAGAGTVRAGLDAKAQLK